MGKVTQLILDQFTAFAGPAQFDFCPGINVLIGANSTGKTHVMKAIYALLKTNEAVVQPGDISQKSSTLFAKIDSLAEDQLMGIFKPAKLGHLVHHQTKINQGSLSLTYNDQQIKVAITTGNIAEVELLQGQFSNLEKVVFLPVHELLSIYPGFIAAYLNRETAFDQTYYDLAVALSASPLRESRLSVVESLMKPFREALAGATVSQEKDQFYMKLPEGNLEAHLVSEGYRKLASLLYLLNNGSLNEKSILLWDEPETNLNPRMITNVVEAIKVLSSAGMQIFISTHDYLLSQELSLAAEYSPDVEMRFFALYKTAKRGGVQFDQARTLTGINNNPILDEFAAHFDREARLFGGAKE